MKKKKQWKTNTQGHINKINDSLDRTMWKVYEYNLLGVNEFPHLTFVYILKITE